MNIKAQLETDTYFSHGGYYCIRQDNFEMGQSQTIVLSLPQLELLVLDMQRAISRSGWWFETSDEAKE